MDTSKIIKGVVNSGRYTVTAPIVKEDYGLYLQIEGVELPSSYQVDFSNSENSGTSVTMIGNADGVLIPRQFIDSGKDVFAFLYHVGSDFGRTVYKFRIPNKVRPGRTNEEPTPEEQSVIDQAINALNEAVAKTAQDVIDADASAQTASADADRAEQAKEDASTFAQRSANSAQASADYSASAQASATASANSASASAQIKADVEGMVDDAQGYAQASAQSASASAQSASDAQGYAQSASTSETNAQGYASQAQTSAQTASAKAQDASQSATTASQKATEASQSASQALSYKTDAESAKVASQTAQGLAESARDSAITAKNDAESARDDAVQAKTDVQNIADGIDTRLVDVESALIDKAPIITDTASGAIASFSDGADDLPLKSLVVDINPVQDLHGQENPYPAGGGVNKFKYNASVGTQIINGITWTLYEDGSIQVSGTASGASTFRYVLPERVEDDDFYFSGNYKFYAFPANISSADFQGGVKIGSKWYSVYADGYSRAFNDADGKIVEAWFQVRVDKTVNATIRPMIYPESESTPTAWSPYENICPISGWTEVDVEQRGVNVWDEEWELGGINNSTGLIDYTSDRIRSANYIPILPNTTYYASIPTGAFFVYFYGKDKNFITPRQQVANKAFTTPPNAFYMRWHTYDGSGATSQYGNTYNHDISINYPSTDHSYHPYTGRSITIDLGQTVYGGKLDVLSGELVVDRAYALLDDPAKWETMTGTIDFIYGEMFANRKKYNNSYDGLVCSYMVVDTAAQKTLTARWTSVTSNQFGLRWTGGTLDQVKADTQANKIAIAYELATPITIQLTPQQVNSLLGVNNLWADSGDSEVEYRADTKLYINKKIAEAISALS